MAAKASKRQGKRSKKQKPMWRMVLRQKSVRDVWAAYFAEHAGTKPKR